MSDAVVIQLITTLGACAAVILGKVKLDRIGRDAREAREQTANEHADAEYPNLRDELTAMRGDLSAGLDRLEAGQKRHDSEIRGIRKTQSQQTDALARLDVRVEGRDAEQRREHAALTKRLDEHLTTAD
ncbi:hypothetical protein ACFWGN_17775 [Oerskovia sp. NPDC060338]|uniref:hypothetical protein n=1 Tax=Oerskovia sp. NPDC060338 TaxID=3347100 RepID=UPI00365256E3